MDALTQIRTSEQQIGATMDDVTQTPAHAKPARRDLLWVLVLILACGLLEVWASWLQIGAVSGFPKLGGMTTGWILPVTSEAYWTATLYAWLVAPAGPRSKRFAMWSGAAVFVLSLAGQESDHLLAASRRTVPPAGVVGFVTALPLIAVALVTILIHLRQLDHGDAEQAAEDAREAAAQARRELAEASELAAVRAELETARAALEPLQADLETVRAEAAAKLRDTEAALTEALTRAEALTQKLATVSAQKKRAKAGAGTRTRSSESDPTNELRAVMELRANPKLMQPRMSGELARALGLSAATGRRLHGKLVADGALTQYARALTEPLTERSQDQSGERS